jgi:hypothetical protein
VLKNNDSPYYIISRDKRGGRRFGACSRLPKVNRCKLILRNHHQRRRQQEGRRHQQGEQWRADATVRPVLLCSILRQLDWTQRGPEIVTKVETSRPLTTYSVHSVNCSRDLVNIKARSNNSRLCQSTNLKKIYLVELGDVSERHTQSILAPFRGCLSSSPPNYGQQG